jgi:hypothetical protein
MPHCGAQGNSDAPLRCGCGAAGAGVTGRAVRAVPLMRLVPSRDRARGAGARGAGPGGRGPSLRKSRTLCPPVDVAWSEGNSIAGGAWPG